MLRSPLRERTESGNRRLTCCGAPCGEEMKAAAQRETKRSQACPMKVTWAMTVRKVLKLEVGLNNHGCRTQNGTESGCTEHRRHHCWKGDVLIADLEELETMDASEIYSKRLKSKEVIFPKQGEFIFQSQMDESKPLEVMRN